MILQVLGAAVVFATMWAALQIEGVPTDSCAGEGTDSDAGQDIAPSGRARPRAAEWQQRPVLLLGVALVTDCCSAVEPPG
jgi:hypothetical protein